MSIWQGSIWQGSLWLGSLWKGGLWGVEGINLNLYNFYVDFKSGIVPKDLVSGQAMTTVLEAGRFNYAGTEFGENVPVIESNGDLLSNGPYSQLVPYSEDTSNWTGSGPWTRSINLGDTGTYTVSTDLNGATVMITAGTATIDAGASATFGNPDQFVVTGIGTVTITTDIADPKAQLTNTVYKLPYAINTTAGTLSVPLNYSDADEGNKWPIGDGSVVGPNLLNAFDGVADGTIALDDDFSTDTSGNYAATGGDLTYNSTDKAIRATFTATTANDRGIFRSVILTIGTYYDVTFKSRGNQASAFGSIGDSANLGKVLSNPTVSAEWQDYHFRITPTGTTLRLYLDGVTDENYYEIDDLLIQEISTAKGQINIPWTPKFDAADVSGVVHILTANDDATSFLFYNGATQEIHAFDGTNTAVVAYVPVNGTLANILLDYGDDSGPKMRLTVDTTVGAQATFAGSLPNADHMSSYWEEEVPGDIGAIIIAKEPSW